MIREFPQIKNNPRFESLKCNFRNNSYRSKITVVPQDYLIDLIQVIRGNSLEINDIDFLSSVEKMELEPNSPEDDKSMELIEPNTTNESFESMSDESMIQNEEENNPVQSTQEQNNYSFSENNDKILQAFSNNNQMTRHNNTQVLSIPQTQYEIIQPQIQVGSRNNNRLNKNHIENKKFSIKSSKEKKRKTFISEKLMYYDSSDTSYSDYYSDSYYESSTDSSFSLDELKFYNKKNKRKSNEIDKKKPKKKNLDD